MGEKVRHWIEGEMRSLDLYGALGILICFCDQEK